MKVIGLTTESAYQREYIATVTHSELEQLSDRRYGEARLKELKIGDTFDLGAGANFRDQIQAACKQMVNSMVSFEQARSTMMRFAVLIAAQKSKPEEAA